MLDKMNGYDGNLIIMAQKELQRSNGWDMMKLQIDCNRIYKRIREMNNNKASFDLNARFYDDISILQ